MPGFTLSVLPREARPIADAVRRRGLIHTVFLELQRRMSIPSDWIHCTTFEAVTRSGRPRTYVQLKVMQGDDDLLPVLRKLQESLRREVQRRDHRATDWLGPVCWQFSGERDSHFAEMPEPGYWI